MRVNQFSNKVREFHRAFDHPLDKTKLTQHDVELLALRGRLIKEEAQEAFEALTDLILCAQLGKDQTGAKAQLLKELSDVLVVTFGTAEALGLPIEAGFNRVHQSNMSKLGGDGKPKYREDGKVLKGPFYRAPDLKDLVE